MNICLFCSARTEIDDVYHEAAKELGELIARRGHVLYFGGGLVGLMGTTARAVHENSGRVVGVIPARLRTREVAYEESDELIVTDSMSDRKAILIKRSDAFVVLPGGFGTLDELLDAVTMRQLGYHSKPIAIVNTTGFFDRLSAMFDFMTSEGFAHPGGGSLYRMFDSPAQALDFFEESRSGLG